MYLYIIDYEYYDSHQDKLEKDQWTMAAEDDQSIRGMMELNESVFAENGYEMKTYAFRRVSETGNGYKILIETKSKTDKYQESNLI